MSEKYYEVNVTATYTTMVEVFVSDGFTESGVRAIAYRQALSTLDWQWDRDDSTITTAEIRNVSPRV